MTKLQCATAAFALVLAFSTADRADAQASLATVTELS